MKLANMKSAILQVFFSNITIVSPLLIINIYFTVSLNTVKNKDWYAFYAFFEHELYGALA